MNWFILFTFFSLIISYKADKKKTIISLKLAFQKISKILPSFIFMLIIIAIVLYFFSENQIKHFLGNVNVYYSLLLASSYGSIVYLPGFIAFPLCGILLDNGIKYMVISAFSSTLMMVGIVTFPVEKEYLGVKLSLLRNLFSLVISLIVALFTGLIYGELF